MNNVVSDYSMLLQYKKGNIKKQNETITYFYNKYKPLMCWYANKYYNTLTQDSSIGYDDILSEYSLLIWKVLDYIKLEKIVSDKFSFAIIFHRYLSSFSNSLVRLLKTHKERTADHFYAYKYRGLYYYIDSYVYNDFETNNVYKQFKNKQIGIRKKLLTLLEQQYTSREIAKELGFSNVENVYYYKKILYTRLKYELLNKGEV